MLISILTEITQHKKGVEIGGPSETGQIIYENADKQKLTRKP